MAAATTFDSTTSFATLADDLRIVNVRALRGPNVTHLAPIVVAELRAGDLAHVAPADVPGFMTRLLAVLPGIASDAAAHGASSSSRRALPLSWGESLLRVALELERLAGTPVTFGRVTVDDPARDRWTVAVAYDEAELTTEALHEGARILRDCLRGEDAEIEDTVRELTRLYHRSRPGPTTLVMIEAARRRGIPVRRNPDDGIVQLGLGATQRRLWSTMTDFTSVIGTEITSDKHWTKQVLKRVGLAIPDGETARTLEGALEIAEDIGFPVLLKPLDANNGRGISGRIDTLDGVRDAWPRARAEHEVVVVERFAEGNDHRVVVVNGRVVACVERIPAHVVGDGTLSIRALGADVNRDPNRSKTNPNASLAPLPLDELTERFLARTGRTLDSVPAAGEIVYLRATANISTGGTAIDRTDEMHPTNRALCELAAGAVGLDIAGLDVLTPDISVPFRENGAVIIEVNASPGIRMHTHPDNGVPRDVPGAILDMLYPPGAPTTIPLIAITGTNGKTTTTRLVAHLFRQAGFATGLATTDGVYFQEHLLLEGDLTGPFAANVVLSHPGVEVAVIETARGGILRSGLGYDQCDVGIVLNVTSDHLGMRGIETVEQLAEVKGVIAAVVKPTGYAVLNADDPLVYAMRERTPGKWVFFTTRSAVDHPIVAGHLASGGIAGCIERGRDGDMLVIRADGHRHELASVAEVPLTFGGAAKFQLENILAASLAAYTQGMSPETIRAGLMTFIPSAAQTPGRVNVFDTARGRVIIDYAHNVAAIGALMEFVGALPAKRRIALLGMPGDRRDDDIRAVARLASSMDQVIFKEHDAYRRGRAPGEVAALMADALAAAGFPRERIATFLEEDEAVVHALGTMQPGDVVAITADDAEAVRARVEALGAT
ncbi:MAG TPA: cyanophycin synthetase [Gemmatimonadaceae bacterium]